MQDVTAFDFRTNKNLRNGIIATNAQAWASKGGALPPWIFKFDILPLTSQ